MDDAGLGDVSTLTLGDDVADAAPAVLPVPPASVPHMQDWLLSIACVNFDLELGPDVEFLYPPLDISKEEKDNIAFSSFPDTAVFSDGSLVFSWRVREVPLDASTAAAPHIPDITHTPLKTLQRAQRRVSRTLSRRLSRSAATAATAATKATGTAAATAASPASATPASAAPGPTQTSRSISYLYGYTFFLQRRDASLRRGYFQKSLVLLTHLPYVGLFSELVARVGRAFFEHGVTVLELFLRDVVQWPAPTLGASLELPVMGSLLHVLLPAGPEAQRGHGLEHGTSAARPVLAAVPSSSLLDTLYEIVPDLWHVWECVLLGEPVLLVGHDPRSTSEAVWHLLDLIRPVLCAGDFRPYFHIHDYDVRALVHRGKPPPGVLLGVTNPFFLQTCAHWPHRIQLGRRHKLVHGRAPAVAAEPGFRSPLKRRVSRDLPLLKQMLAWRDDPAQQAHATATVRRYFSALTEKFLAPLHEYMATLLPADVDDAPQPMQPFHASAFLQWLRQHPAPLRMRQRSFSPSHVLQHSLYADFLQCPHFSLWLQHRMAAAQDERAARRITALVTDDVLSGRKRSEVEAIDLYLRLQAEVAALDAAAQAPPPGGPGARWRASASAAAPDRTRAAQRARLTAQMERLLTTIPEDLRWGLVKHIGA